MRLKFENLRVFVRAMLAIDCGIGDFSEGSENLNEIFKLKQISKLVVIMGIKQ